MNTLKDLQKKKTFMSLIVKNRERILDFGDNKIYCFGDIKVLDNKTKGFLGLKAGELHLNSFSRLRLLIKMLFSKSFVFVEIYE